MGLFEACRKSKTKKSKFDKLCCLFVKIMVLYLYIQGNTERWVHALIEFILAILRNMGAV